LLSVLRQFPAAFLALAAGCQLSAHSLRELPEEERVNVVLDANSRRAAPGRNVKFYVDITNTSSWTLDLTDLKVELTASPAADPDVVSLRGSWSYRWPERVLLPPGKRLTLPIVPENRRAWNEQLSREVVHSEFPLFQLAEGEYAVRASVVGRFRSEPYVLRVQRPDLAPQPIRRLEPIELPKRGREDPNRERG
jgi:hypothetical protein